MFVAGARWRGDRGAVAWHSMAGTVQKAEPAPAVDAAVQLEPTERIDLLMRDLRSSPEGLSGSEAERRLIQYGPNELTRRGGPKWPRELVRQLTHPLALLLWLAAALSFAVGSETVAIAVLLVIALNAVFALVQEMQAERAVEALAQFLPQQVTGDATAPAQPRSPPPSSSRAMSCVVEEGDRIAADMRLIAGAVEVDLSTLNGESAPALRSAELIDPDVPPDRGAGPRCSAAPAPPAGRHAASCSRPGCTPSSAASPRSPSGSRTSRARSKRRCAESPG